MLPKRLRDVPEVLTAVPRRIDQIPAALRTVFRDLVTAKASWPLLLHGPAGTGKTCAALCLIDFAGGMYHSLPDFLAYMGRVVNDREHDLLLNKKMTPEIVWARMLVAPIVVLDELGARDRVSDFHYETLKKALDVRERKPAVYISNLPLGQIATLYDDRIASRLSSGTVHELKGIDRRIGK